MSAQLAEQPLELDTARIYQLQPKPETPNPILEAEPEAYQPPPNAVLNRDPAKKRGGRKPGSKNKPRKAKASATEAPAAPPATEQPKQAVAAAPGGRSPSMAAPVSQTTVWAIAACMFALGVGATFGFWAIR
jgi:hypothetical protein